MKDEAIAKVAEGLPTLALTRAQGRELCDVLQGLVETALAEFQHYERSRQLPVSMWDAWKDLRTVGPLRVHRERQSLTNNTHNDAGEPMLPEILVSGHVRGTIKDVLLGAMATTPTAMRLRSMSAPDGHTAAKILQTLQAPSEIPRAQGDAPDSDEEENLAVQSLQIKWEAFETGSSASSTRQPRDCTYAEVMGITTTDDGTRVGYVLRHSFAFDAIPPQDGLVRAQLASWAVYMATGPGHVQCFAKSFYDLGNGTPGKRPKRHEGLACVIERTLALCYYPRHAAMKKARHLLFTHPTALIGDAARAKAKCLDAESPIESVATRPERPTAPFGCGICGTSTRSRYACRVCEGETCNRCLQDIAIHGPNLENTLCAHTVRLCTRCHHVAERLAPRRVAAYERRVGDHGLAASFLLLLQSTGRSAHSHARTSASTAMTSITGGPGGDCRSSDRRRPTGLEAFPQRGANFYF